MVMDMERAEESRAPAATVRRRCSGWLPAILWILVAAMTIYGGLRGSDAPLLERPLFTDTLRLLTAALSILAAIVYSVRCARSGCEAA
jgi:hypothetical protein